MNQTSCQCVISQCYFESSQDLRSDHVTKLDQTKDNELRTNPVSGARAALAHSAGARLALDPGARARHRTGSPGTGPRLLLHLQERDVNKNI